MNRRVAQRWMTTQEAAEYLRLTPKTLCNLRQRNEGPKVYGEGQRARYDINDLDTYITGEAA